MKNRDFTRVALCSKDGSWGPTSKNLSAHGYSL